jgi:hypothetical protein
MVSELAFDGLVQMDTGEIFHGNGYFMCFAKATEVFYVVICELG